MSNYKVTNWTEPPDCLQCDGLWDAQSGTVPWVPGASAPEWLLQHMLLSNFCCVCLNSFSAV